MCETINLSILQIIARSSLWAPLVKWCHWSPHSWDWSGKVGLGLWNQAAQTASNRIFCRRDFECIWEWANARSVMCRCMQVCSHPCMHCACVYRCFGDPRSSLAVISQELLNLLLETGILWEIWGFLIVLGWPAYKLQWSLNVTSTVLTLQACAPYWAFYVATIDWPQVLACAW